MGPVSTIVPVGGGGGGGGGGGAATEVEGEDPPPEQAPSDKIAVKAKVDKSNFLSENFIPRISHLSSVGAHIDSLRQFKII